MAVKTISEFQKAVREYYRKNGRAFPWRFEKDPYRVWISEVMLQQTQTARVILKYGAFLKKFPTVERLAAAPLPDVLAAWQGLGYNRRALSLRTAARKIVDEFGGKIPWDVPALNALPGIGRATACAIATFAFNIPTVFIETNIRAVFLSEFFGGRGGASDRGKDNRSVRDDEIMPLVERALDRKNPREWYYALMDYGVALKKSHKNPSLKSRCYSRQSKFAGSSRQLRGMILKTLLATPHRRTSKNLLKKKLSFSSDLVDEQITALAKEGFLIESKGGVLLGE